YKKAVVDLTTAWNSFSTELVSTVGPAVVMILGILQGTLTTLKEVATFLGLLERTDFGGGADSPQGVGSSRGPRDSPLPAPLSNASGGYIRGPGSGTSDSIWARLSNGEFVVNAASTRRLGTSFLNGLNSF